MYRVWYGIPNSCPSNRRQQSIMTQLMDWGTFQCKCIRNTAVITQRRTRRYSGLCSSGTEVSVSGVRGLAGLTERSRALLLLRWASGMNDEGARFARKTCETDFTHKVHPRRARARSGQLKNDQLKLSRNEISNTCRSFFFLHIGNRGNPL